MNEQNRLRLERIATRHSKQEAQKSSEPQAETPNDGDEAFLAAFGRARDEVLRPVMAEVGLQLKAAGYLFRIIAGGDAMSPSVELHVIIADRGDSKDTIRFLARKDAERGWQVIGELELKRSPIELTRFEAIEPMTHDVVEQLVVDAVEQMFASTGARNKPASTRPALGASPDSSTQKPHEEVETLAIDPALQPLPAVCEAQITPLEPKPEPEQALPAHEERETLAVLPPLHSAPEMRWARWAGTHDAAETGKVNMAALRRASLPFSKGAPSPQFFAAADAARAEQHKSPAEPTGYETMALPVLSLASVGGAPEGEPTEAVPVPPMSLEQYAAFCAEIAVFSDRSASIYQRYGLVGEDARKHLDDAFMQLFRADPALQQRGQALAAHYGDWYRRMPLK